MIFEELVSGTFVRKVEETAQRLQVCPDYLMAIMWSESRLDPRARNPRGGATGLIQFMPATARYLGTTCEALREMRVEEQLYFVEKFFSPYAARCKSFCDWYMACFFPAGIGKPDDYVLQASGLPAETVARQNPVFDLNRDGRITVGEFREKLKTIFPREVHTFLF